MRGPAPPALGRGTIGTTPVGYRLRRDRVHLDRDEFEDLVRRGREHLGADRPESAAQLSAAALALWSGRPFSDLEDRPPGVREAARLDELRLSAQEDLLQARLDAAEHQEVAAGAVLVGEEPWHERRSAILSLAQYRCGRQADALATIRKARGCLGAELGLDPRSDLVRLEQAILGQDPGLAPEREARMASQRCPWKGLAPHDADRLSPLACDLAGRNLTTTEWRTFVGTTAYHVTCPAHPARPAGSWAAI
jgi:DNA-binding SARP family transcriptional activator